jgi:outer membrane protein
MKRYTIFLILFSLTLFSQNKIGFIDSQRILNEYRGAAEIKRRYEQKVAEWRERAEKLKREIANLREALQTQNLMLSEEAKLRKVQEIESKEIEYQQFIQNIWGENGEAEELNRELMQPLLREIDTLITKIGEEEGFTIILDASSGALVYADDEMDITDRVLEDLNRKYLPEEIERVEFYVVKFLEEDAEAKDRNLGDRIKNLINVGIKGSGGFKEIEPQPLNSAKSALGIIREEDIDLNITIQLLRITVGDFIVIGRTWLEGGLIYLEYSLVDRKQEDAVITETIEVGVEENMTDVIPNKVVGKIVTYYK